jgi:hypothetical protein
LLLTGFRWPLDRKRVARDGVRIAAAAPPVQSVAVASTSSAVNFHGGGIRRFLVLLRRRSM